MLLTKGETGLGLIEEGMAIMIVHHLNDVFGTPIVRRALARGYVRLGQRYIARYNGRFGTGITVRYHNTISTRYCDKDTLIYEATPEEIDEAINYCMKRAGIQKCKVTF